MKIKDLLEFNPEADIKIIMPNCLPFEGNLDLGWSNGYGKENATEVCIFLGDISENIA